MRILERSLGKEPRTSAGGDARRALVSVVVPCFNEEEALVKTHHRLTAALGQCGMDFEIIYIDDGSADSTLSVLRGLQTIDERIRVLGFSRNFGHQMAITAGIEHAAGDAVVVIDADLQDPPEVILDFLRKWLDGYDVVYGVRTERAGETAFKLVTAKLFYRFMGRLSETRIPFDTGDFRLMDRRVVDALLSMPERDRFVRGMVSWLGFSQISVSYRRQARVAGVTKFSLPRMVRFAMDGIFSFSILPLRLATWTGFAASALSVVGIALVLLERFFGVVGLVKGWSSTVIAVLFIGGVQLICMGIIGEYVGRIYGESKHRPLYVVRESLGFEARNVVATPSGRWMAEASNQ
ncbi:MAG: glycosyltransferase family 2 protein [Candidatus Acidiferrales bacterium]